MTTNLAAETQTLRCQCECGCTEASNEDSHDYALRIEEGDQSPPLCPRCCDRGHRDAVRGILYG